MIYIRLVKEVRFTRGLTVPEWAKYVKVTKQGNVWRAYRPIFYREKPESSQVI